MPTTKKASPPLPWKVKLFVAALSFAVDITRRKNGTVNRRLMSLLDMKSSPSPTTPVNGVKTTDIQVDPTKPLWFRLYLPETLTPLKLPVVFFFHGGGFVYLSPDSKPYNDVCIRWARELGAVVVSVNFRLAPEHRWPCQMEDCVEVVRFVDGLDGDVFDGFPSRTANLKNCFLAGDSAGGNLAHHVALEASEHQFSNIRILGVISIQPFFGGEERTESETSLVEAPFVTIERTDWMWNAYLPNGSNRDHPACNVFGPNSVDISGSKIPPTIVFVGGFDPLKDWQKGYYEGLKKAGKEAYLVEYPDGIHSFYIYPELPLSSNLIEDVRGFMQKHIN